jgi:hypothetical protein
MDTLNNLLSKLSNISFNGSDWIASCPCVYHGKGKGDATPSLYISIGQKKKLILKCWGGCNNEDILLSVGLKYKDLLIDEDFIFDDTIVKQMNKSYKEDISLYDEEYKKVLSVLELRPYHEEDLLKRGFDKDSIKRNEYRTLRKIDTPNIKSVLTSDIPGLKNLDVSNLFKGIIIPVRKQDKSIITFKIRRFSEGPKYIYLSDKNNSTGAPVHFPLDFKINESKTVRITEGELKADLSTLLDKRFPTLSIPGITHWGKIIKFLNETDLDKVIISFDYKDVKEKDNIRYQLVNFIEHIPDKIIPVLEYWDTDHKAIDDLLADNKQEHLKYIETKEEIYKHLTSISELGKLKAELITPESKSMSKKLMDFPIDIFPETVSNYIYSVAKTTDAPVDFPALSSLIVCASAIGCSRRIRIKKRWFEFPIIYSAIIAPAGSSKSPSVNAIQRPIILAQAEAMNRYLKEVETSSKDKKPVLKELYTTETTVAALTDRLINNPKGLLISTDEILSWIKSFNSFSSSNDQQFYLTIWNGQAVKVDRKTGERPVTFIKYPYVSVLGSIQPKKLPDLYHEGRGDDGFLDRFLFSYPITSELPYWKFDDESMTDKEDSDYMGWSSIVNRLIDIPVNKDYPEALELTKEARMYAINWYNTKIVDELRNKEFPEHLKGVWLKLKAYFFRFALIIQLMKWANSSGKAIDTLVDEDSCMKADKLCEYFKSHSMRVAASSNPSVEVQQVDELSRLLESGKSISAKDLIRLNNPILPKKIMEMKNLFITSQFYGIGNYHPEFNKQKDVFVKL